MADLPILPLNVPLLLADTTGMNAEEYTAYTRILWTMWLQPQAMLPHNLAELRRISGIIPQRWPRVWAAIAVKFIIAGGMISQKRLTDTRLRVQEVRRKRVEAAEKRWRSNRYPPRYGSGVTPIRR